MKTVLRKVMCCMLVAVMVVTSLISSEVQAASVKYKTYTSSRFGYSVKYPDTFTKRTDTGSGDGTKLFTSDQKAQASIWNSYGKAKNRTGITVVDIAKKNRKITVVTSSAKEANYYYTSGKNIVQYYHYFLSNGEIAFQITYPKKKSAYYDTAVKGMIKSVKKNKKLTLKN